MDKHVLHNVIHQDSNNNSNDCPVCNGALPMTNKSGLMGKASDILKKKQKNGYSFTEEEKELLEFAQLNTKDRNELEDKDFAYIDSKGERHLPIHDASHVRNALARFNQTGFESEGAKQKAKSKIATKARELGIDQNENKNADIRTFVNLMTFAEKGQLPTRFKILPTGTFKTRYGETKITYDDVKEMKQHFDEGLRNSSDKIGLPIDLEHGDTAMKDAAGAWIKKLDAQPDGLYTDNTSYTSIGNKSLNEGIYKLFSPSFYLKDYVDPETGKTYNNVLTGGAFCNKPVLGHSLPPLVYSENGQNTLLTEQAESHTLFIELSKQSMDLHEIAKKEKTARISDEQAYLTSHKEELTFAEYKKEGFLPEPAKPQIELSERVTTLETKLAESTKLAEEGAKAKLQLARMDMKEKITKLVKSDKGVSLPVDQIDTAVELAMSLTGDSREKYFKQLEALPKQDIFTEKGSIGAIDLTGDPGMQWNELVKGRAKEKNIQFSEAEDQLRVENPNLFELAYQVKVG